MPSLSPLTYGTVIGRYVALIADSLDLDADLIPDVVACTGSITFTPSAPEFLVASASPAPATILATPTTVYLDINGYISWENTQGVQLLATNDGSINPTGFTYTVTFNLSGPQGAINIQPFSISVPASTTVDLTTVTPVPQSGGTFYNTGAAGAAAVITTTSSTSMVIGTGSKTFTTTTALSLLPGTPLIMASSAAPSTVYMAGIISAISGTSVTVNVTATAGSGTPSSWDITTSGLPGAAGTNATVAFSTSTTSNTLGTGSMTFTTAAALSLGVGGWVLFAVTSDPLNSWMLGIITAISGTSVTANMQSFGGTGTYTTWTATVSGPQGPQGVVGATGPTGPTVSTDNLWPNMLQLYGAQAGTIMPETASGTYVIPVASGALSAGIVVPFIPSVSGAYNHASFMVTTSATTITGAYLHIWNSSGTYVGGCSTSFHSSFTTTGQKTVTLDQIPTLTAGAIYWMTLEVKASTYTAPPAIAASSTVPNIVMAGYTLAWRGGYFANSTTLPLTISITPSQFTGGYIATIPLVLFSLA